MILIGLGANLPSMYGPPIATLTKALDLLAARSIDARACSRWYRSAPVPLSDQPWFINAVASVETELSPAEVLRVLHGVEADLGRARSRTQRFPPRAADLDLLDHHGTVTGEDAWPVLPHPRMHRRSFVLAPLADVAPAWRHPVLDATAAGLLPETPGDQVCEPLAVAESGRAS